MKLRMSLAMAGILVLTAGCAAGGGTGGSAPEPSAPSGDRIATGERERTNDMTRTAADALDDAASALENSEDAAPFYQQALSAAMDAIAADSTNPLPHLQAARANIGLSEYEAAARMFSRAEELRPVYAIETEREREQIWINLYSEGAPLVNSGEYEEAIEIFRAADVIYGDRPEVKFILGQLLVNEGEYDEAIAVLESAVEIVNSDRVNDMDSTTVEQWRSQAADVPVTVTTAYINAGRYDEAKAGLRDLLAEDPSNVSYLSSLANVFVRMEMPDSATAIYDQLLATDGLDGTDYYDIGVGRYQSEDYAGAAQAFERAFGTSVNDRDALELYGRSMMLAWPGGEGAEAPPEGALEQVIAQAERWKVLDPANRNAYLIVAQTANRIGDSDAARANVEAIEGLAFLVDGLQIQRDPSGGGLIVGSITNQSLDPGAPIALEFTFYDAAGTAFDTRTVSIRAPEQGQTAELRIDLLSDQKIHGYGYAILGG